MLAPSDALVYVSIHPIFFSEIKKLLPQTPASKTRLGGRKFYCPKLSIFHHIQFLKSIRRLTIFSSKIYPCALCPTGEKFFSLIKKIKINKKNHGIFPQLLGHSLPSHLKMIIVFIFNLLGSKILPRSNFMIFFTHPIKKKERKKKYIFTEQS